MKGEQKGQLGFGDDLMLARAGGNATLERMQELAPWAKIDRLLSSAYASRTGRPSHPPLVMFKMTLLEHLYDLSDPQCEAHVKDRLSFMRFVGLGLHDDVPDETALVRFRSRLREAKIDHTLLDLLNGELERAGLMIKRGTLLDATFVQSRGRHDDEAGAMGHGPHRGKHGYKAHVGVDQDSELIRKLELTQANVNDGAMGAHLICGDEGAVIADRGYDRNDLRRQCERQGCEDGIMKKIHAGSVERVARAIKARNKALAPVRAAVERVFADWKCRRSLARARYTGLLRNTQHLLLLAFTHNLRRWTVMAG